MLEKEVVTPTTSTGPSLVRTPTSDSTAMVSHRLSFESGSNCMFATQLGLWSSTVWKPNSNPWQQPRNGKASIKPKPRTNAQAAGQAGPPFSTVGRASHTTQSTSVSTTNTTAVTVSHSCSSEVATTTIQSAIGAENAALVQSRDTTEASLETATETCTTVVNVVNKSLPNCADGNGKLFTVQVMSINQHVQESDLISLFTSPPKWSDDHMMVRLYAHMTERLGSGKSVPDKPAPYNVHSVEIVNNDANQRVAHVRFLTRDDAERALVEMQQCVLVPEQAPWESCRILLSSTEPVKEKAVVPIGTKQQPIQPTHQKHQHHQQLNQHQNQNQHHQHQHQHHNQQHHQHQPHQHQHQHHQPQHHQHQKGQHHHYQQAQSQHQHQFQHRQQHNRQIATTSTAAARDMQRTRTRQRRRRDMRNRANVEIESIPTVLTFVHDGASDPLKQTSLATALTLAHRGSALDPNNTTVFVGSLMSMASESILYSLFSPFGKIVTVNIPRGQDCGFVQFTRKDDAALAIATLQNYPLAGGLLRLSWGRSISEKAAARAAARAGLRWVEDEAYSCVLLVFLHGFKGSSEHTFGEFPDRLCHLVQQTHPNAKIESIVYPTYETRGALRDASDACLVWLNERVAERAQDGVETAVVLVGHSMGGIVAADVALTKGAPRIVGVLAFDTPYFGVNPHTFKHQFHAYAQYATAIRKWGSMLAPLGGGIAAKMATRDETNPPSNWTKAILVGVGTMAVGLAGAGASMYAQKSVVDSYTWFTDHIAFVGNLWDEKGLYERIENCKKAHIPIHLVYNVLEKEKRRSFILVPAAKTHIKFAPLYANAPDEVAAHCGMFRSNNPAYFNMGLDSAAVVSSWLG
ncbi:hypothetical protein MCUN1_003567 [Malassezia cuniculi]|uniref:RRM domain-containing protein n=1 Tax=Malassezia cuniculi TaxID=948313 RepID=A0AAF0EX77_9BASI|nr:hypothetical protein MCUN1_003567 [Malassezia cuniculi]